MAHQYQPETIFKSLKKIEDKSLVLPAIQRGFVWKKEQIEKLFDSLMQKFPCGTLLFWEMNDDNLKKFSFYNFLEEATEKDNFLSEPLNKPKSGVQCVMDGQQRLTALNIGLKGSFTKRKKNSTYITEYLYINLLSGKSKRTENDILGSHVKFEFKFRNCLKDIDYDAEESTRKVWFRVGKIIDLSKIENVRAFWRFEDDHKDLRAGLVTELSDKCQDLLEDLRKLIHDGDVLWSRSIPADTDNSDALEIFTRTNQGGTKLSKGDMIFSMAVNQWADKDARSEIDLLISELNTRANTDKFSKDLILSAGIMIGEAKAKESRNRLISPALMKNMENNWEELKKALLMSANLLDIWGITNKRLLSTNAILPIAYYLFLIKTPQQFDESAKFTKSRNDIHKFLLFSLAKGVWGGGANTLLDRLRKTLQTWHAQEPSSQFKPFPYDELVATMEGPRSSLRFSDYDIDNLLRTKYKDARCFFVLSLMLPEFYGPKDRVEIDHIFPTKIFSRANFKKYNFSSDQIENLEKIKDELPNLLLLSRVENRTKGKELPSIWLKENSISKKHILNYGMLGDINSLPESLEGFEDWFSLRKEQMRTRLKEVLPTSTKTS